MWQPGFIFTGLVVSLAMHAMLLIVRQCLDAREDRVKHEAWSSSPGSARPLHVSHALVVLITGIQHHADRVQRVLDTWGRWLPRNRLLLISDTLDVVLGTVEAPDTLGGHEQSQRKWYHAALVAAQTIKGNPSIEWVCIVDDDTFLYVPNLLRVLGTMDNTKRAWYGQLCAHECNGPCVCGGAGWVAPTSLFMDMADDFRRHGVWPPPCCAGLYNSDQVISKWMNEVAQAPFVHRKEFRSFPPDLYMRASSNSETTAMNMRFNATEGWGQVVSFHYMSSGTEGTSKVLDASLLFTLGRAMFGDTAENTLYH